MEYGNEKYTDEELKKALIQAQGQPTKAAEILNVDYSGVYRRIRKNPELYEVQKSYRARTFQNVSNMAINILLTGIINEPKLDDEGRVVEGEFIKVPVDYKTRINLIPSMMQTFKTDDGIKEEISVETKSNIDYDKLSDTSIKELLNATEKGDT
ncbi:MAG: hypothetical protein ACTTJM_00195 [Bergeyella cardium]